MVAETASIETWLNCRAKQRRRTDITIDPPLQIMKTPRELKVRFPYMFSGKFGSHGRQTSWTAVIDRRCRVAIPPGLMPWKLGQRVFWRTMPERPGSAVVSVNPRGTVRNGRILSSRIQRMRVRLKRRTRVRRSKTLSILDLKGMLIPAPGTHISIDEMRP